MPSLFHRLLLPLLLLLLTPAAALRAVAQTDRYEAYIKQYQHYAVHEMKRHGIPASITLAQGLLESAAGTSRLARQGKNHFGIKTGSDWKGRYMLVDDDAPNERFRVYRSVKDSYEDHSRFLVDRPRYAALFRLSQRDYKGWAHGLKKAGYATNPRYASLLIDLIERYDLTRFDGKRSKHRQEKEDPFAGHPVRRCNKSYYVIAQPGDTYRSIAEMADKSERKIRRYNEVDKHRPLEAGDIVYLEEKRSKADKSFKHRYHVVSAGESLHSIAQRYGIRIKTLFKNNRSATERPIAVGDSLRIR